MCSYGLFTVLYRYPLMKNRVDVLQTLFLPCLFFVYCCSNFDLTFAPIYSIILSENARHKSYPYRAVLRLTTYQTIDTHVAYGNNGYKTAKEHFSRRGNGYKKPFAAERTFSALFGSISPTEYAVEPFAEHCLWYYAFTAFSAV